MRRLDLAAKLGEQRTEAVLGEEGGERGLRRLAQRQLVERDGERQVVLEADELARQPRHVGARRQRLAELGLLHLVEPRQHCLDGAELRDELGRALRSDTAHPRNRVDRVAHQRQNLAELLGRHAELLDDVLAVDPAVLHRVVQVDARADQLHQILVRRHDRHVHAGAACRLGVTRDDVVRLDAVLLDARYAERADRVADQRELRDQVVGRRRAVRLVPGVHLVAERMAAGVEDHREVGRGLGAVQLLDQLPQHRRDAVDRVDHRAAGIIKRWQAVIGAEDIARAVDEIEVLFRHAAGVAGGQRGG